MYRVFDTKGDTSQLTVEWTRHPSDLDNSTSNFSNHTEVSNGSLNASITVWDLKITDFGNYEVVVCSNCTCNSTVFHLYYIECDPQDVPQPYPTFTKKVIAEPALQQIEQLEVTFMGSTSTFDYPTAWDRDHENDDICNESAESDLQSNLFSCNRTENTFGNCSFTANLYIYKPTYTSSGNYTVQAVGGGSGGSSQIATYELSEFHAYNTSFLTPKQG